MRTTLSLAGIGLTLVGALAFIPAHPASSAPIRVTAPSPADDGVYHPMQSFAPMVQAVQPAVVSLQVTSQQATMTHPFFGPMSVEQGRAGEGSGFVISEDGLLLSNAHVVQGADEIMAIWEDGREMTATVLGVDRAMDVALLKLDEDGPWPHVTFGDSEGLRVGDWVVAMGNPLGLGHTVTAGIVSAKGRGLGPDLLRNYEFIQTDAAINEGNSGGPLFNLKGEVVGINTAIIQGANTVAFSIPIDAVESVLEDLRTTGQVQRGFMGVYPMSLTPRIRAELGIRSGSGAILGEVFESTPAARAGLLQGDVVVEIGDEPVTSPEDLIRMIARKAPGDSVTIRYERDGEEHDIRLRLGERPSDG